MTEKLLTGTLSLNTNKQIMLGWFHKYFPAALPRTTLIFLHLKTACVLHGCEDVLVDREVGIQHTERVSLISSAEGAENSVRKFTSLLKSRD